MTQRLAELTTLCVGGPARDLVRATTEAALVQAVLDADAVGVPVLLLGGGSNLLVSDEGFDGLVVVADNRGLAIVHERDRVIVTAGAGEPWDALVAHAVEQGWAGVEALSWIPGSVGATPIQNVGAYGQDVSQVITNVRVLDRAERLVRDLPADECEFGYRRSIFKHEPGRWVVLSVSFALSPEPWSIVRYAQLADALGVSVGDVAVASAVRASVGELRRAKGMVLDPLDADTRSAGSFFTNPIVPTDMADTLPEDCPRFASGDGVKLSAAWLIEQAGVTRGWQVRASAPVRVSTKHTLAITNANGGTAQDVLELARAVRRRVRDAFGIDLEPEPVLVGCSL